MRDIEQAVDEAARRLTISLMRLCEAIDHLDADTNYSRKPAHSSAGYTYTQREARHNLLDQHYREWFRNHAL